MPHVQTWLLDFDETLATGSMSWAFNHAFPKLVEKHQLTYDAQQLRELMLVLQQQHSQNVDLPALLHQLFTTMGWPESLQNELFNDLLTGYQPALYDDVLPFLHHLRDQEMRVYVVSNNRRSPDHVRLLGLEAYVHAVFTPHLCPGTQPKPHRSMWDYIRAQDTAIDPQTTVVVGDDPWSDGAFADACGLPCWIIDRLQRYDGEGHPYRQVQSLATITTTV